MIDDTAGAINNQSFALDDIISDKIKSDFVNWTEYKSVNFQTQTIHQNIDRVLTQGCLESFNTMLRSD